jgi:hypothetical protein
LRFFSQTFSDQATLESDIGWMLGQWLYTIPSLMLGGFGSNCACPCL